MTLYSARVERRDGRRRVNGDEAELSRDEERPERQYLSRGESGRWTEVVPGRHLQLFLVGPITSMTRLSRQKRVN